MQAALGQQERKTDRLQHRTPTTCTEEKPVPSDSLTADLLEELVNTRTVDAHEHLPPEAPRLDTKRDFYSLFQHYCSGDLVAAGATDEDMAAFADHSLPLADRWLRFRPFLSAIRTGAYAQSALIVVRDILGFADLTDSTFEGVSEELQRINTPGLYDRILKERCNIAACVECWCLDQGPYPDYFYHLAPGPEVVDVAHRGALDHLSRKTDHAIHSLGDLLECMSLTVDRWRANPRVVGVKSAHAYSRSLAFQKVSRQDAENVLTPLLTGKKDTLTPEKTALLQDFLMFELVARVDAAGLAMVFHTGLQAGNFNRIANANPLLLQPLLEAFPRARIDLFHGGMPWVREIAVLAKYFPGVHLNMAWMHIINPAQARSALSEWLDMVPNTKIFGFGGDYSIVEKVYGHLALARQNIACVLAEKIRGGVISRSNASCLIQRLMFDNANAFYRLELDQSDQ
jgi:uncharacterized protein